MKHILTALSLIIGYSSFAQKAVEEKTLILKADVLTLINDFTFPIVQVSLEKRLSKQFSIIPEIGMQLYNTNSWKIDTSLVKWNGFRVGIEGRYYGLFRSYRDYNNPKKAWAEKYLSLDLFYRQNRYNSQVRYYRPNDTATYIDCFAANKKAWGINLMFGIQITKGRFVSNFYGGIGLLNRSIKNYFREYDNTTDELQRDTDVTVSGIVRGASLQENSGTIGNIILGIRLGFKL